MVEIGVYSTVGTSEVSCRHSAELRQCGAGLRLKGPLPFLGDDVMVNMI